MVSHLEMAEKKKEMESSKWSCRELTACKDSAENESLGHDHHNHETKFTKTSSRHASSLFLPLYHTVSKCYSTYPGSLKTGKSSTLIQSSTLESWANSLTLTEALISSRPPRKCLTPLLFLSLLSSTKNVALGSLLANPLFVYPSALALGGCIIEN